MPNEQQQGPKNKKRGDKNPFFCLERQKSQPEPSSFATEQADYMKTVFIYKLNKFTAARPAQTFLHNPGLRP